MRTSAPIRQPTMLIIAGHLDVDPDGRTSYLAGCVAVVDAARAAPGNLDFTIAADLVDPGRIVVYERWQDEATLLAFRGSGPSDDQQGAILGADVQRYEVAAVGPP